MKILELRAENVQKLKAVHVTPAGSLVPIAGKNGAGKSSVLDAIWWALGGAKNVATVPVRRGAERATITLKLGGDAGRVGVPDALVVTRNVKADGDTSLVVSTPEGARFTSPQGVLDALLGALTFDPLAFAAAEPKEQLETLRGLLPQLANKIQMFDDLNRGDTDRRKEIKRQAEMLRARAGGISVPDPLPAPVDPAELMRQLQAANDANAARDLEERKREEEARYIPVWVRSAVEKRQKAEQLFREAEGLVEAAKKLEDNAKKEEARLAALPPLPQRTSTDDIRAAHAAALQTQQILAKAKEQQDLLEGATKLENEALQLTTKMAERERAKREAIAKAEMPVPGLGFGDGHVTFQGLPFAQAATAEQLKVSLAIAAAANPKLKVLLVRRGNDLDADNLSYVAKWAEDAGYQVWLERVAGAGPGTVEITDGMYPAEVK